MFVIQHQEGWSVWIFRPSLTRTTRRRKIDSCLKRVTATDKINERIEETETSLCKARSCCPTDAGKKQREKQHTTIDLNIQNTIKESSCQKRIHP